MTSIAPLCYLSDLFTNEAARGKGVGRVLIEAVYERRDVRLYRLQKAALADVSRRACCSVSLHRA
jgi:GNAT superfamily N-acetyltransferase